MQYEIVRNSREGHCSLQSPLAKLRFWCYVARDHLLGKKTLGKPIVTDTKKRLKHLQGGAVKKGMPSHHPEKGCRSSFPKIRVRKFALLHSSRCYFSAKGIRARHNQNLQRCTPRSSRLSTYNRQNPTPRPLSEPAHHCHLVDAPTREKGREQEGASAAQLRQGRLQLRLLVEG